MKMINRNYTAAANWKLNFSIEQARLWVNEFLEEYKNNIGCKVNIVVHVPLPYLIYIHNLLAAQTWIKLGAQNVSEFWEGAYTGEVSAFMLRDAGALYCIVGHSERRKYFHETNEQILNKIKLLQRVGIYPILCVGESEEERRQKKEKEVIERQLSLTLNSDIPDSEIQKMIIAYEPVWAIGVGKPASPSQAQEMHAYIRELIAQARNQAVADSIAILYGGSVAPENAEAFFAQSDIDGTLLGKASLAPSHFWKVVKLLEKQKLDINN
jgi:triosephosphate isomerase